MTGDSSKPEKTTRNGRFMHGVTAYLRSIFSPDPFDLDILLKKRLIAFLLVAIISHAVWMGLWIFYRLGDIGLIYFEPFYNTLPRAVVQALQLLVAMALGAGLFCGCFIGAWGGNRLILRHYRVSRTLLTPWKVTAFQFAHAPVFGALMTVVTLLTGARYYERGFIIYPFVMAAVYFLWMAFLNAKIYRGRESRDFNFKQIGKASSRIIFIACVASFVAIFLIVPLFILGPYDTIFTVIW